MQQFLNLLSRSYLARFVVILLLQAILVDVSLYLVPAGSAASLIWPPAAAGLAFLWFGGLELWPALVAAFFFVFLGHGISPPLVVATALGNATESLVGAFILREYVDFNPMFARLRDSLGFILAGFLASLTSATIIYLGVSFFTAPEGAISSNLWVGLWVGHTVSILSFAPFLLRWLCKPSLYRSRKELLEGVLIFGCIVVPTILLSWTSFVAIGGISLLYPVVLALLWAALRTGPRGMSLGLFLFTSILTTGVIFGYGPAAHSASLAQALFGTQMVIGTLSILFLILNSITEERKEAVVALQSHVHQLESAVSKISSEDKAKTDFIAVLAHELRNPLSSILTSLELIKQNGVRLVNQQPVDTMATHVHTMARLLDDLLDISRVSQKKFTLKKEQVDLRVVIRQALEMADVYISSRHHAVHVELPEQSLILSGDPVRLGQIFVNLFNNAGKYTDPNGTIWIKAVQKGTSIVVEVADTGIGIAPGRLRSIFEPLQKDAEARKPGGLGIGLSLVKRLAELHGGKVEVYSAGEGKGSRFTVTLPCSPALQLDLPPGTRAKRGRFKDLANLPEGPRRVLVVDDNQSAAEGLGVLLRHNGHTVTVAYDAPEALALAEQEPPEVAILDIGLPTMDGYELAAKFRERFGESVTLIALSGYGQTEDKERGRLAGFEEHLVKPVSIADVERVLLELTKND